MTLVKLYIIYTGFWPGYYIKVAAPSTRARRLQLVFCEALLTARHRRRREGAKTFIANSKTEPVFPVPFRSPAQDLAWPDYAQTRYLCSPGSRLLPIPETEQPQRCRSRRRQSVAG